MDRLGSRFGGRPVTIEVPAVLVPMDFVLMAQVLVNLLDNALKYSPPDSVIRVVATEGKTIDISVGNSGVPIPDHEQRRIFEPFFRGAQARRIPGTGMGLAIVRQVVEAHHGTVRVWSAPDTGTEVVISLPQDGGRT
jgi:two-component system sensor histidine kinase KdpD